MKRTKEETKKISWIMNGFSKPLFFKIYIILERVKSQDFSWSAELAGREPISSF
jgi:hypothetical protein